VRRPTARRTSSAASGFGSSPFQAWINAARASALRGFGCGRMGGC
jgi:hypothetical protein